MPNVNVDGLAPIEILALLKGQGYSPAAAMAECLRLLQVRELKAQGWRHHEG